MVAAAAEFPVNAVIPILVQRLGAALVVAWLALTLVFVALRWIPGDAVDATLARGITSEADIAARRDALGLNDPIPRQYFDYLGGVLHGDWGESLVYGQPVTDIIAQNIGPTAALALGALLLGSTLGITLGILAGLSHWPPLRYGAEAAASLALATPVYWTATLAIYLFSVQFDLLPGVGASGARNLVLPVLVLGFHTAGSIAHVTASAVKETAQGDFVRTARAKGLPTPDVLDHILRVGLLPVVAVIALQFGFLLGGTVITETIFARRGLGRVLLRAISDRDYPVIQGVIVLSALAYSLINALADVLYTWIDPRINSHTEGR
ncbi:MAG: ABC transporter permease [Anaerolineae bacterium]|nr:ABC transporter permease [Anaerolineae bacterium]